MWRHWWKFNIERIKGGHKHYWRKGVKRQTNTKWERNEWLRIAKKREKQRENGHRKKVNRSLLTTYGRKKWNDKRNEEWQERKEEMKMARTKAKGKKWMWRYWWKLKMDAKNWRTQDLLDIRNEMTKQYKEWEDLMTKNGKKPAKRAKMNTERR